MDSKSQNKDSDDREDMEPNSLLTLQSNLIIRFSEFAFKVLNSQMDEFFDDQIGIFDQDEGELTSGRGETLEQYQSYELYLSELEVQFDGFAIKEGLH